MVRPTLFTSLIAATYATAAVANQISGAYIAEVHDDHDHAAVYDHLKDDATTRLHIDYPLFRAVSFKYNDVDSAEERVKQLAAHPAVKNVWPVRQVKSASRKHRLLQTQESKLIVKDSHRHRLLQTQESKLIVRDNEPVPQPLYSRAADTFSPHVMTQVDKLRARNITGAGVKLALVDTGIDYTHPALGKCFGKGCLVGFGTDFVGDAFDGSQHPVPDNDPMDCNGHGTHVAGVVAAQSNPLGFTGAAPGVTLGAYKVMGCTGGTANDVLIAAFNQAYQDGANIISASVVQALGWSEDPWAVAASRIVDKGVPCVISAGNDGNAGLFYLSSGASGKGVVAVGSHDNVVAPLVNYHSSYNINHGRKIDFIYTPGDSSIWGVSMPLYATSLDPHVTDDACKPLPANTPDLSKSIVLVRRGGCLFDDKIRNLVVKGAQYIIFYNDEPGTITVTLDNPAVVKSTAMVSPEIGSDWVKLLKAGRKLTINVQSILTAKPVLSEVPNTVTPGAVSTFSSWGPTWEMEFKPQFGAPGAMILSTYPVALGSYAVQDGTSQSAPLVAAIIALISQVRGTFDPALMTNLLSSTAKPEVWNDGNQFYGELAPAAQQGAGMVQAFDAAYTTTLLSPSSLSFNDTDHLATNLNFTLVNKGKRTVTYNLGQTAALTMYTLNKNATSTTPFPNDAVNAQAVLTFTQNKITLAPGNSAVVGVTAKPATEGVDPKRLAYWSGYVDINVSDGTVLSLPYQGLTGSLHNATVLQPDQTYVFPSDDSNFTRSPDNTVFQLPRPGTAKNGDRFVSVYANLALGSPLFRVYALPVVAGVSPANAKPVGQILGSTLPLNDKGWTVFDWYGKLMDGSFAPAGKYQFATHALKIFGDAANPADWDVAYTQPIVVEYKK
ncbi:hypothetical protein E4U21_002614 [Claviceps maximensis]|nr:hypothetical protein E4U21_002614 [Claviceps maximensis]